MNRHQRRASAAMAYGAPERERRMKIEANIAQGKAQKRAGIARRHAEAHERAVKRKVKA